MKKIIAVLFLLSCFLIPAMAQDNGHGGKAIWDHGDNVSAFSYRNVNVYRIYEHRDAYIVLYEQQGVKIGKAFLPKSWFDTEGKEPRKLEFRNKPKGLPSYMTVLYKDGEFYKVILTLTRDHRDPVWGLVPHSTDLSGMNTETLDITF